MLILAGLFTSLMTGCSSPAQPSQKEKEEIVNFYIGFAKDATSLDSALIKEKYSGLAAQNFAGQGANGARDKMLAEFNSIKPDLFSKLYLGGASNGAVANSYLTILLLSLASESEGVDVTMPIDAVSVIKDEKLGVVYEIDRSKITATVPENLSSKVTRPERNTLSPVKLIKDKEDGSWKVLASTNLLAEIGIPISEKISTPTTTK